MSCYQFPWCLGVFWCLIKGVRGLLWVADAYLHFYFYLWIFTMSELTEQCHFSGWCGWMFTSALLSLDLWCQISLGDVQSNYLLTTAENELGVVVAHSEAGSQMVPISWCEMQCPRTHAKEFRKVARVQPEYLQAWEPWNVFLPQGTHSFPPNPFSHCRRVAWFRYFLRDWTLLVTFGFMFVLSVFLNSLPSAHIVII